MIDLNDVVGYDDYGGLGRRVYRNLQMEDHLMSIPDPDSLLGFEDTLDPARLEDELPMDADELRRFLKNNPSISVSEDLNCEIYHGYCPEYSAEEQYCGKILDEYFYGGETPAETKLKLYEERWNRMWPVPQRTACCNINTRTFNCCTENPCICEMIFQGSV